MSRTLRTLVVAALGLGFLAGSAYVGQKAWRRFQNRFRPPPVAAAGAPTSVRVDYVPSVPAAVVRDEIPEVHITEVARNLQIVWALRSSPDGRLFMTERPGRIRVLNPGATHVVTYAELPTVLDGESGLMGLALHPRFPVEPYIFVMYTVRKLTGGVNRVSRLTVRRNDADDERVLVDDIAASRNHDGGALEFGPDGMLYIGTGDASIPELAPDLARLNGKILRLTADGAVPADNPFPQSPVWAYGFRNVSGLAFHPETGELWAASHGPSSVAPGEPKHMDSVYIVRRGGNHGWPFHLGGSHRPDIVSPVVFYPERPVPPGGLAFVSAAGRWQNNLFMTSLRGQEIIRHVIADGKRISTIERWWPNRFGRIRAVTAASDGSLFIGTSNRDGRGSGVYPSSDFVYRLTPAH